MNADPHPSDDEEEEIEDPDEYDLSVAYSLACALRRAPHDADILIAIAKRGSRRLLDWALVLASLRHAESSTR